jgi:hypothetical protein
MLRAMATTAPAPAPISSPQPPAGFKASETWLAYLAFILGALPITAFQSAVPAWVQVAGLIVSVISAGVHSTNRMLLKRAYVFAASSNTRPDHVMAAALASIVGNAVKPDAPVAAPAAARGFIKRRLMAVIAIVGIVGSCATLKTMSGDFATCAKANLGQMVTPPVDASNPLAGLIPAELEQFVAEILTLNLPALEAQLTAVAAIVSVAAVKCAIAAINAAFSAPAGSGSGSGSAVPAARVVPAGLARANAWVAAH